MLDIGWSELLIIAVIALFVIGPKDLPKALRTLGTWVRKARLLAREFQNSVDDMIREAELEDARKQVEELRRLNPRRELEKAIDPSGELRGSLDPAAGPADQPAKPVPPPAATADKTVAAPEPAAPVTPETETPPSQKRA